MYKIKYLIIFNTEQLSKFQYFIPNLLVNQYCQLHITINNSNI